MAQRPPRLRTRFPRRSVAALACFKKGGQVVPSILWSGKLTFPMKVLVQANNLLALATGSAGDIQGMKERVKRGYEGEFSDHVRQYDSVGYHLQQRSARVQLEGLSFEGMRLLDVGCGTGALADVALEKGARAVVCGDISYLVRISCSKRPSGRMPLEWPATLLASSMQKFFLSEMIRLMPRSPE